MSIAWKLSWGDSTKPAGTGTVNRRNRARLAAATGIGAPACALGEQLSDIPQLFFVPRGLASARRTVRRVNRDHPIVLGAGHVCARAASRRGMLVA
jgi:hypothetical protein